MTLFDNRRVTDNVRGALRLVLGPQEGSIFARALNDALIGILDKVSGMAIKQLALVVYALSYSVVTVSASGRDGTLAMEKDASTRNLVSSFIRLLQSIWNSDRENNLVIIKDSVSTSNTSAAIAALKRESLDGWELDGVKVCMKVFIQGFMDADRHLMLVAARAISSFFATHTVAECSHLISKVVDGQTEDILSQIVRNDGGILLCRIVASKILYVWYNTLHDTKDLGGTCGDESTDSQEADKECFQSVIGDNLMEWLNEVFLTSTANVSDAKDDVVTGYDEGMEGNDADGLPGSEDSETEVDLDSIGLLLLWILILKRLSKWKNNGSILTRCSDWLLSSGIIFRYLASLLHLADDLTSKSVFKDFDVSFMRLEEIAGGEEQENRREDKCIHSMAVYALYHSICLFPALVRGEEYCTFFVCCILYFHLFMIQSGGMICAAQIRILSDNS